MMDVREEYIRSVEHRNVNLRMQLESDFRKVKPFEEAYGCDVYDFDLQEILSFYTSLHSRSTNTLANLNANFTGFVDFCIDRHLSKSNINHFRAVTYELLSTCVNDAYLNEGMVTRKELLTRIGKFSNPCDKFLMLGIFEGLGGTGLKDFFDLRLENFQNDGTVILTGTNRRLKVSKELRTFAEDSAKEYTYVPVKAKGDKWSVHFKENDTRIIKAINNASDEETPLIMRGRLHRKLARLQELYEYPVSRALLRESGRIHMLEKLHKEGETWQETYNNNRIEVNYYYGNIKDWSRWTGMYGSALPEE